MKSNRVRFNVGGKMFETTATTLATAGPDSFFGPLLSNNWNTNEEAEVVFTDRDPECFAVILNLLRTGELSIPPHVSKDSLIREAQFYGVLELVRVASWVTPLNGDFLLQSSSITCRAHSSATKRIFGSPNGGFCVSNDESVYVYDWMLREHPPIHLEYFGNVNDALWVGTNNIAITTTNTVGMFDAATGKLQYKFVDQKGNQVSGATSMCLSESIMFHLYQSDFTAIGMLDHELGKSVDTFYLSFPDYLSGISFGRENVWRPINLQTIDGGSKCLLATYAIRLTGRYNREYFEAQIIDTRDSSYDRTWSSRNYNHGANMSIRGATLMEDRNSIFVMNWDGKIGFLDLRFDGDVQWCSKKVGDRISSDRVVYQNERIFMLSGAFLLVYSVPDLVLTAKIPIKCGSSSILDFSISGDRLFMLKSISNLVDVWETPRSCLTIL